MMPSALELQYDKMSPRSGMGRRQEGMEKKHMLRITRRNLMKILKEESVWINEMPVTQARGWGSEKFPENYPHLQELAKKIDNLMQQYGFDDAIVETFDSGYSGISINLHGKGKPELVMVDQPGKINHRSGDQSLGYIAFGKYPQAIHTEKAADIFWRPSEDGRMQYDVQTRAEERESVYADILDVLEGYLEEAEETGSFFNEADTKKYNDDSALKGKQSELPDELQKGIIDKTVEDREEDEEEKKKEKKDEGFRALNRLIREELTQTATDDEFVEGLRRTWDAVQVDVGIRNPTWEDKADEAMSMFGTYESDLADKFGALKFKDQDMLLRLAFDDQNFYGKMY